MRGMSHDSHWELGWGAGGASEKKRGEKNDSANYRSGRGEIRVSPRWDEVNVRGFRAKFPDRSGSCHTQPAVFWFESFFPILWNFWSTAGKAAIANNAETRAANDTLQAGGLVK